MVSSRTLSLFCFIAHFAFILPTLFYCSLLLFSIHLWFALSLLLSLEILIKDFYIHFYHNINTNVVMLLKIQSRAVPEHSNIWQAFPWGTCTAAKCIQSGELIFLFYRGLKGKQIDSISNKTCQLHQGVFTLINQVGKKGTVKKMI